MLEYEITFRNKEVFMLDYKYIIIMNGLQKDMEKSKIRVDKSLIKRIPSVEECYFPKKYVDSNLEINKEEIKKNNRI